MVELTEDRLGFGFGLLGGSLFLLGALLALIGGAVDLGLGRSLGAADALGAAVLLAVIGGLAVFFARIGHREWKDRPLAAGALLLVIGVLGFVASSSGERLIALVGAIFVFLAGVLYLVPPMTRVLDRATAA